MRSARVPALNISIIHTDNMEICLEVARNGVILMVSSFPGELQYSPCQFVNSAELESVPQSSWASATTQVRYAILDLGSR